MSAKPLESATLDGLYDQDFTVWCDKTARLLCARRLTEIDIEHLAEEVRDMGVSQRHEVDSRLRVLLLHLLKWDKQPKGRSRNWISPIDTQRAEMDNVFRRSPSLRRTLPEAIINMYPAAVRAASRETGLAKSAFPSECPYSLDQIMDHDFPPLARPSR